MLPQAMFCSVAGMDDVISTYNCKLQCLSLSLAFPFRERGAKSKPTFPEFRVVSVQDRTAKTFGQAKIGSPLAPVRQQSVGKARPSC